MEHYPDLKSLLSSDTEARSFYDTLPEYVKEMMSQREDSINSYESLCHYAENLTKGDS